MRYLTTDSARLLAERLADLPRLAKATVKDTPAGSTVASAAPPGVDLDAVDAGREQPHLLHRLSQCIRAVCEEMPVEIYRQTPDLPPEGCATWRSETAWLIATIDWWQGDDWCAEWIHHEEETIRHGLIAILDANAHYRTCGICGGPVEIYKSGDYAMAECPRCQRIIGAAEVGYGARIAAAQKLLGAALRST